MFGRHGGIPAPQRYFSLSPGCLRRPNGLFVTASTSKPFGATKISRGNWDGRPAGPRG